MSKETVYEEETPRKRRRLATLFQGIANRLRRGERVPIDDEQSITVNVPAEPELDVELEREEGQVSLEIELEWEERDDDIETDVVASKARFELFADKQEKIRWRLVHQNGNIIADSAEGYASRQKAKQGLESVRKNAPGAYVVDQSKEEDAPTEGGSKATFELFADKQDKWRWRLRHGNGNIIADSGQGYASKQKAKQGLTSVQTNVPGAPVENAE